jgi:uncharacterized membrane protein YhaH (DUF805 family)
MTQEQGRFFFLYRQDQGRIGRATFWKASAPILIGLLAMTAAWIAIMPEGARDLTKDAFFDTRVLATYAYLLVFTLALLIGAVMLTFLGAKRLRDRGRPPWLAAAPFLLLFFDGAMHWLAARAGEAIAPALLFGFDVLAIAAVVWAVLEMGFGKSR